MELLMRDTVMKRYQNDQIQSVLSTLYHENLLWNTLSSNFIGFQEAGHSNSKLRMLFCRSPIKRDTKSQWWAPSCSHAHAFMMIP